MKRFASLLLAVTVLLSGCGSASKSDAGKSGGLVNITVAGMSPLSGSIAPQGESMRYGVELALKEKATELEQAGFKVSFLPMDDQAKPELGTQLAEQLLSRKDVVALVGPLTSGVAMAVTQKVSADGLACVEPGSTSVAITERRLPNVTRLVARDDAQGPAAAGFIKEKLQASSLFIIHDKTPYGQGLADEVKKAAANQGLKVDGYEGITVGEKDFSAVLSKVKGAGSPVTFFGGVHGEASQLLKQIKEKGMTVQFVGGDGLDSGDLVKMAGEAANGVYYTSVVADITGNAEGQSFAQRYTAFAKKSLDSFAAYSYDAALVVVNALKEYAKAHPGKAPTRKELAELIRKTNGFQGVATTITFDEKGDNKEARVYVYQVQNTKYPGVLVK